MRKSRNLPPRNPVYAFIVDGECEVWYFNMMKRNEKALKIDLKPEMAQKKRLEDQFKQVKESAADYDKVFWVIDFDTIRKEDKENNQTIQKFREYCRKLEKYKNVAVIINNPCLEFWFLLHFENTNKPFSNCESAANQLKKHLKDYEKTQRYFTKQDNDIYLKLKPNLKNAIENATKLGKFDFRIPHKSISEMNKLIRIENGEIKFFNG